MKVEEVPVAAHRSISSRPVLMARIAWSNGGRAERAMEAAAVLEVLA